MLKREDLGIVNLRLLETKVLNLKVAVYRKQKIIHLLEIGNAGSLTNFIDHIQSAILEYYRLDDGDNLREWTWISYTGDGFVADFNYGGNENQPLWYDAYMVDTSFYEEMQQRYGKHSPQQNRFLTVQKPNK